MVVGVFVVDWTAEKHLRNSDVRTSRRFGWRKVLVVWWVVIRAGLQNCNVETTTMCGCMVFPVEWVVRRILLLLCLWLGGQQKNTFGIVM